jgi:hypothetical protein
MVSKRVSVTTEICVCVCVCVRVRHIRIYLFIAKSIYLYLNRRHPIVFLIFKIKLLFRRNTIITYNHQHPSMATFVVLSRPSSDQNFPVEGTIRVHYTLWDHILFAVLR